MSIAYKSTGTLINELITTRLKLKNIGQKQEFIDRVKQLTEAINERTHLIEKLDKVIDLINTLEDVLENLWWEQEILYQNINWSEWSYDWDNTDKAHEIAMAGINSLKLNKKRSELIREIDKILGEESSTVLEKSWK